MISVRIVNYFAKVRLVLEVKYGDRFLIFYYSQGVPEDTTASVTDLSLSNSFNALLIEDKNISNVEIEEQVERKRVENEDQSLQERDNTPRDNDNEIHENRTCQKLTSTHLTEMFNSSNLVSRKSLAQYFKTFKRIVNKGDKGDHVTVGLVRF